MQTKYEFPGVYRDGIVRLVENVPFDDEQDAVVSFTKSDTVPEFQPERQQPTLKGTSKYSSSEPGPVVPVLKTKGFWAEFFAKNE